VESDEDTPDFELSKPSHSQNSNGHYGAAELSNLEKFEQLPYAELMSMSKEYIESESTDETEKNLLRQSVAFANDIMTQMSSPGSISRDQTRQRISFAIRRLIFQI